MRRIAAATLLLTGLTPAAANPFGAAPVADAELAGQRGGFLLPNGLDVSIGIAVETRVDGVLALRTVLTPGGSLSVFASGGTSEAPSPLDPAVAAPTPGPVVRFDRGGAGPLVVPGQSPPNVHVAVSRGPAGDPASDSGSPLPVAPNGPAVDTAHGQVRIEQSASGSVVILDAANLQVRHLVGAATGLFVANTADNRAIDSVTSVNVDLANASVLVGSNLPAVDSLAATAGALRNPF